MVQKGVGGELGEDLDQGIRRISVAGFVILRGHFGPKLVQELSKKWGIPKNFMFIGSPGDHFPYGLQEMGGVRLVI
ncbi:hypothetical protein A3841_05100 [Pontibacter flavimaris]|uniref:Uncharacterized protein n=1 Tax=Pontibacter flavimaris TaxID=1797110 RepID=A0A1Q5P8G6_9BACT|nr:hypothetical protein A3841_05100 [Pontibacter flavimaris]